MSGGLIKFTIPGSSEKYIDVNDIQIYMFAKVTKTDGGKIDSAIDKVGLNYLAVASFFKDVSLTLGTHIKIEGGQMLSLSGIY